MKIEVEKKVLMDTLKLAQSVVEKRNTIPILSNVLIEARDDNSMIMTATDLDIEITETFEVQSIEVKGDEKSFTVPARTLYDVVRKLPNGALISVEVNNPKDGDFYGARLKINAGRSNFELPLLPPADFPKMTNTGEAHDFTLTVGDLKRLIDKTRFAISTEETRYYLNGIYFHQTEDQLTCVATDGHRLAKASMSLPDGADGMEGVIIPRKAAAEIRRLIDSSPDTDQVKMSVTESKICVEHHSAALTSKIIDGFFPDYERVIPPRSNARLVVDCPILSDAIDRVSTVTKEKARSIKLSLTSDEIRLDVRSSETGEANEVVSASFGGENTDIGLNSKYMIEALGLIGSRDAEMFFSGPASPVLLLDQEDQDCLFVIMPLRV